MDNMVMNTHAKRNCLVFLLMLFFSFAFAKNKIVGFDFGLVTGIPVYGDTSSPYKNRVIIGSDGDISLKVGTPLKILFGYDLIGDINWDKNERSNHLDYAFWTGIKVYPGFGGLNGTLAYALGARTDFIDEEILREDGSCEKRSVVETSAWGNGFKIGVEYDFLHNSERKTLPAVGFFYRLMPRGGKSYDNIFAFYVNMVF